MKNTYSPQTHADDRRQKNNFMSLRDGIMHKAFGLIIFADSILLCLTNLKSAFVCECLRLSRNAESHDLDATLIRWPKAIFVTLYLCLFFTFFDLISYTVYRKPCSGFIPCTVYL